MFNQITVNKLDNWARTNPRRAQEILPELIIKLILATSDKIISHNFPIEKGIQYSGYDGILQSAEQTDFFPDGMSVWEFGTNDNTLGKFNSDISKRIENSLGVDITDTTFIFATLKVWNHRKSIAELISESKRKYPWKDIRILDASNVVLWLTYCPSVMIWLSEIMGIHISGVKSADWYWKEWALSTIPQLKPDFFVSERQAETEKFNRFIRGNGGCLLLISESCLESILFGIASVIIADNDNFIKNRVIIVEDLRAWEELMVAKQSQLILIPTFNFYDRGISYPDDVTVILPTSKYDFISNINYENKIELSPYTKLSFRSALETLDCYKEEADFRDIERNTNRSFLTFYRSITKNPTRKSPQWLKEDNIRELVPALLAGGWNNRYSGDKEIIENLSNKKYDEYISDLNRWMELADTPIFKVLESYQLISVKEMWSFMSSQITHNDLEMMKNCVLRVFEEVINNGAARISYSDHLLHGMSMSLIILKYGAINDLGVNSLFIDGIVMDLIDGISTEQQWHNIALYMSCFAEAAPGIVIHKIDKEVSDNKSAIWQMFSDIDKDFMADNRYVNILWTLETLTWYEKYTVQAILILASIGEKGFDYKMSNSPWESLYSIFCLWHPNSCLDHNDRCTLLKKIRDLYPYTFWNLIDKLLPQRSQINSGIAKPKWYSDFTDYATPVTQKEYYDSIDKIVDMSLENIDSDYKKWEIVIEHIRIYIKKIDMWGDKYVDCCKVMDKASRLCVCDNLREQISNHRMYSGDLWDMPEDDIQKLEKLLMSIIPEDDIDQYSYIFKWHPNVLNPIPYGDGSNYSYEQEREHIKEERSKVIDLILKNYGIERFIEFSACAEDVSDMSTLIVEKILKYKYDFELIMKFKHSNYSLYTSILYVLFAKNGIDKLIEEISKNMTLSDDEKGDVCRHLVITRDVLNKIHELDKGIVDYFWQNVSSLDFRDENLNMEYIIKQLLKYDRPFSSVNMIAFSDYGNAVVIMDVLEACLKFNDKSEKNGMTFSTLSQHDILDLLKRIQNDKEVDITRAAVLEMSFSECFGYSGSYGKPKCFIKFLWKNPEEYINLLAIICKNDNGEMDEKKREGVSVQRVYQLVYLFDEVPGCNYEITDEGMFIDWINRARSAAKYMKYEMAFKLYLGRLLGYAPSGEDGIFPHEIVRNFLEQNDSDTIKEEFIVGVYNQRGFHAITGGIEEKKIADKYHKNAQAIRITYPRTAGILDEIGNGYDRNSDYDGQLELSDFME